MLGSILSSLLKAFAMNYMLLLFMLGIPRLVVIITLLSSGMGNGMK